MGLWLRRWLRRLTGWWIWCLAEARGGSPDSHRPSRSLHLLHLRRVRLLLRMWVQRSQRLSNIILLWPTLRRALRREACRRRRIGTKLWLPLTMARCIRGLIWNPRSHLRSHLMRWVLPVHLLWRILRLLIGVLRLLREMARSGRGSGKLTELARLHWTHWRSYRHLMRGNRDLLGDHLTALVSGLVCKLGRRLQMTG